MLRWEAGGVEGAEGGTAVARRHLLSRVWAQVASVSSSDQFNRNVIYINRGNLNRAEESFRKVRESQRGHRVMCKLQLMLSI